MAEEKAKKTKIDLKARLGKTAVGGASPVATPMPVPAAAFDGGAAPAATNGEGAPAMDGSAPPPVAAAAPAPAAIPAPKLSQGIAPPPGISPGIPIPPFGPQKKAEAAPKQTAQAQTIKVEIGEEIHQERKKAGRRAALYAVMAALVGVGLGFVAGGSKEKGDRVKSAQDGALAVEKDIKASGEKLKELEEKVNDAREQLKKKQFPTEVVKALGAINIPFDQGHLENRQIGSLPSKLLTRLLSFTTAVTDLNTKKDGLKTTLGFLQPQLVKYWKEEKDPVSSFSVLFTRKGDAVGAELVQNKDPFSWAKAGDWPSNISVMKFEQGKRVEKKASRWVKGDLTGSDPIAVPIDPSTTGALGGAATINELGNRLKEATLVLSGRKDDPQNETPGIIKEGEDLASDLHKFGIAR